MIAKLRVLPKVIGMVVIHLEGSVAGPETFWQLIQVVNVKFTSRDNKFVNAQFHLLLIIHFLCCLEERI